MSIEDYLKKVGPVSEVKQIILMSLWEAGEAKIFPKEWVESDQILSLTKQKYFDRRIRELRDEKGCDIETGFNSRGKASYRLVSAHIKKGNKRRYLTKKQKDSLFASQNYECQICSKILTPQNKPQADHKIPLSRNGSHDIENWQTICVECNVAKRRVCQGCKMDCLNCTWAFPEKTGIILQVHLSKEKYEKLSCTFDLTSIKEMQDFISRRIESILS